MADDQQIFLGLGSNLDDQYQNLKNGIMLLNNHPHIWVTAQSHIYQSQPMYKSDQDDFYNMVIEIETNLSPLELLKEIKKIEKKAGRIKTIDKNMPRILDIDILAFGDLSIHSDLLEIPHPKISERKFVLKPWNDIAPNFIVEGHYLPVNELLKNTTDISVVRRLLITD